jgi:hypothetical protein
MEPRWNDIDRGEPKNLERNVFQCHFVHHKSRMDWPEREPRFSDVRDAQLTAVHILSVYIL